MKLALLVLLCIAGMQARAADTATCKVETNYIGTIVGKGLSHTAAFEDAAVKCFDRREKLYKLKRGPGSVDEDSGLVMIDLCANIKCAKGS